MRLIHCADIHLDSVMETDLSPEKAAKRRRELLMTFTRLFDWAGQNEADTVLISGDLFDSNIVSAGTAASVLDIFRNYPDIDVYYLRGNHDSICSPISGSGLPENLHLFSHKWSAYRAADGIIIAGAELFTSADGPDAAQKNERLLSSLSFDRLQVQGAFRITMLHGTLTKGTHCTRADSIPAGILRGKGIDYLALGHIHARREGEVDGRCRFSYPGCLEGRGFDECGPHGFILLDIDDSMLRCRRTFVPFASRTIHRVETDITGCMSDTAVCRRIRKVLEEKNIPQTDMADIVLTGETDIRCTPDTELICRELEPLLYMLRVTDRSRPLIDYNAYALDASLKGAFVRLVRDADLSPEDRESVIRTGFRALEGEKLI